MCLVPFSSCMEFRCQDVRVSIPISLRVDSATGVMNNEFSLISLQLPVAEPDRSKRFSILKRTMDAAKQSPEPIGGTLVSLSKYSLSFLTSCSCVDLKGTYFLMKLLGHFPAAISDLLMSLLSHKYTAVLTNVPGGPFMCALPCRVITNANPVCYCSSQGQLRQSESLVTRFRTCSSGFLPLEILDWVCHV